MSSPTKQVSGRRLPSLSNQVSSGRKIGNPARSPKSLDVDEREALLSDASCVEPNRLKISMQSQENKSITIIEVVEFLNKNPKALESYVIDSVNREQLEKWLIRKIHVQKSNDKGNGEQSLSSLSRWKFCVHTDKQKTLQHLTQEIHRQPQKARVIFELVKCISIATHADRFSLYLVSKNEKEIYLYTEDSQQRPTQVNQQKIMEGTTVAAYVAATMSEVHVHDILGDERFPDGTGIQDSMAQSIICQPIIQSDGKLAGVAEFVRVLGNPPFESEDDEITSSYLTWGGITIHYAEIFKEMQRQKNLHNFLLDVIKSLFDEMDTVDGVITNVMTYAKRLVDADRCAMFLCDDKNKELHADLFDEGSAFSKGKEIRFSMERGIAGYVATSGKLLNIKDAYSDPRFNREVDVQTGYTTHTILCVPMKCKDRVVGVVQLINKRKGIFTTADEHAFALFAGYCGLAIRYSQIFTHLFETKQKHDLALDVLSYHCRASEKDVQKFRGMAPLEAIPEEFWTYSFNIYQEADYLLRLGLIMSEQVFQECGMSFDPDTLCRFILTVRKNYRPVQYHNWQHGFSVAHVIFLIVTQYPDLFSVTEKLGLFFGAISHDVDHRGFNNLYLEKINSPIALLYRTSIMERHHLDHTLYLLQYDDLNIFKNVEENLYGEIVNVIKETIMATDILLFHENYMKLLEVVHGGKFDNKNNEHRLMLKNLMMTAADLCATIKPWPIHRQSVKKVVEEFYHQGDLEKELGSTPLILFDRDKKSELPKAQVSFFSGVCVKCYALLAEILPSTEAMSDNVKENLEEWTKLAGLVPEKNAEISTENAFDMLRGLKPLPGNE